MKNIRYNWLRSPHDPKDHHYAAAGVPRPPVVDLTQHLGAPFDQGEEGSCTANALAGAFRFLHPDFDPARNFIYYNERAMEGTVRKDSGAFGRDGVKSLHKIGVCSEAEWPYDVKAFRRRPTAKCYLDASSHRISEYLALHTVDDMLDCLAAGFPFVFGFTVFEAFEGDEVAKTGILNMPGAKEKDLGGHEVLACGYDLAAQRFLVRNSWGAEWGQAGNFTMPFAYLANRKLSDDFWTIRK
jgi:C1A family cysteine protease